jgi:hypothetical protein
MRKMNGKGISIITHLFSFLSPSLKNTHMLGVGWCGGEEKEREEVTSYNLLHAPRNMQQNNERNEQRKE